MSSLLWFRIIITLEVEFSRSSNHIWVRKYLSRILTMIFNQSSIAWRTGVAGLMDMDEVRDNVAAVRDEADCLYLWNGELHRTLSIWNERGGGQRVCSRKRHCGCKREWHCECRREW